MALKFYFSGVSLYKKDAERGLLLYLNRAQAEKIMNEVHSGVCGPHMRAPC